MANNDREPLASVQYVVRHHYERVVEPGAWGLVLIVETNLDLGPDLSHEAQMRVENLIGACQKRLKDNKQGIQRIRLIKAQ